MESTSGTIPSTHATGDAALHSLLADADNLCLYALAVQRLRDFAQSREREPFSLGLPLINSTFITQYVIFYSLLYLKYPLAFLSSSDSLSSAAFSVSSRLAKWKRMR